jgi:hypothetical protein
MVLAYRKEICQKISVFFLCSVIQTDRCVQRRCPVLWDSDCISSIKTIIAESPVHLSYPNVNLIGVSIRCTVPPPPTPSRKHARNKRQQLQLYVEINCTVIVKVTAAPPWSRYTVLEKRCDSNEAKEITAVRYNVIMFMNYETLGLL